LREVLASKSESISVVESTNKVAIYRPLDIIRSPVNGISVPGSDRISDTMIESSVIGCGIALSEEIALDRSVIDSQPLPINLIEVIRFKDETADDTSARSRPHNGVNFAKEDVLVAGDRGCVCRFVDRELSTV
jgi:hypothetical protein